MFMIIKFIMTKLRATLYTGMALFADKETEGHRNEGTCKTLYCCEMM